MGDWFLDLFGGGEGGEMAAADASYDSYLSDIGSDVNYDDLVGSVSDAFMSDNNYGNYGGGGYSDGYSTPDTSPSITPNADNYGNYGAGGYSDGYESPGAPSVKDQPKGMWDKATDFLGDKKNDNITKLGLGLVGNAISRYDKSKAEETSDKKLQELREYNDKVQKEKEDRADARAAANRSGAGSSAMEQLAAKAAIDEANKAKFSASVSGLKSPGLINSTRKKLTYIGGKPVFTDAGQLAK